MSGAGHSPCFDCSARRRCSRRVAERVDDIPAAWARDLFLEFCRSAWLVATAGNVTARVDRAAAAFRQLAGALQSAAEIDQSTLFRIFGAEGLRRNHKVVAFICRQQNLTWSTATLERLIEEARQDSLLQAHAATPWGVILAAYHRHLRSLRNRAGRPLSPKTIRVYLASAATLLSESRIGSLGALAQGHLNRYLHRRRGQAANLHAFVRFASDAGVRGLSLPKSRRTTARRLEHRLIDRLRERIAALAGEPGPPRRRALAAAAVADLCQLPLSAVLALRISDLGLSADGLEIHIDGDGVVLPEALAEVVLDSVGSRTAGPVFLGRNGVQSLSTDAVRHHLQAHSSDSTTAGAGTQG